MRRLLAVLLVVLVLPAAASAGAPFKAVLKTPATAKANVRWPWSVTATQGGKPARGFVTARIKDPIGGIHPVQFDKNTKNITHIPFRGTFADVVTWPPSSRGYPLTFQVIVQVGTAKQTLQTVVTVR